MGTMSDALGVSWDDTKWAGHEVIWRHLRGLRHNPPGFANAPGARRSVFGAALEQSEQLLTAARSVGFASRPILLFYGLSQAGRAIAAGSTLADGSSWQLAGHGIETVGLYQRRQLHAVELRDQGSGSFTQLAPLLGSASLPITTPLGQIWATIPDLPVLNSGNAEYLPVLRLSTQRVVNPSSPHLTRVLHGLPLRFAEPNTHDEIESFLQAYPTRWQDTYRTARPHMPPQDRRPKRPTSLGHGHCQTTATSMNYIAGWLRRMPTRTIDMSSQPLANRRLPCTHSSPGGPSYSVYRCWLATSQPHGSDTSTLIGVPMRFPWRRHSPTHSRYAHN